MSLDAILLDCFGCFYRLVVQVMFNNLVIYKSSFDEN
jgi:hypothetical protein